MTLGRKQLVAVAEFQFPCCYWALRMNLKRRRPEKRNAIWQFWIINYPAQYCDYWLNFCLVDFGRVASPDRALTYFWLLLLYYISIHYWLVLHLV